MAQWGRNDQSVTANGSTTAESSNGAPIGTWALVKGSGNGLSPVSMDSNAHFGNTSAGSRASVDVAMFNNTTPSAFLVNQAVGVFGVSANEMSNNVINASIERPAHAGWVVRRAGTGPVVSATGTGGVTFITGESATVSNGSSNATLIITANSQGNISSVAVTNAGAGWTNTAMAHVVLNRQKYVTAVAAGGSSSGYTNTDYIVISNTGTDSSVTLSNATATLTTNSSGGITTVTMTSFGLFQNTKVAGNLLVTAYAANGAASSGTGATFTPTLTNSSGGSITLTLGGRAGRVATETLVAMGSLGVNTATSTGVVGNSDTVVNSTGDDTYYPGN
jgi:hypothetical protein